MHSVRIELAKLILVVTRITYQATGDAGTYLNNVECLTTTRKRKYLVENRKCEYCCTGIRKSAVVLFMSEQGSISGR